MKYISAFLPNANVIQKKKNPSPDKDIFKGVKSKKKNVRNKKQTNKI